ncbi:MAG TPA: dienelactone hydrolase [Cytophagales bacterium]|nr:dienelactone hydrolase [Cytophagales bacterium]HAA19723.1 dienelactone hydrolase [Cytophagales bacterium]HAP61615.1 dienelactone hydrolase [Cytophagales bacterium]
MFYFTKTALPFGLLLHNVLTYSLKNSSHKLMIHQSFTIPTSDGSRQMLADVRYVPNGSAKPVLIFMHGFKGFKDWGGWHLMMDFLAHQGFVVMKANLSHNGTTSESPLDFEDLEAFGHNTFSQEQQDVGVWIDRLHSGKWPVPATELDATRLGLIGHSRGGAGVILKAAADPRVKAVAAWAPVADLTQRYSPEVVAQWKEKGVHYIPNSRTGQDMPLYFGLMQDLIDDPGTLSVPNAVRSLSQSLLVVHGDADPTVPVGHAHSLKEWQPKAQLHVVPGADHVFSMAHPWNSADLPVLSQEVIEITSDFFKKNL